jgi:UDP-N-acetylmuramoylalanine--D-glutamate ligase
VKTFVAPQPGNSVAVLGAGDSGEAAAGLLLSRGITPTVLDTGNPSKLQKKSAALAARGIRLIAGDAALTDPSPYEFAVLSPGIDPNVPLVQKFTSLGTPIIGELELAYHWCRCPVIGITGTNGKTTTTQLVASMLNACGIKTEAAGNIGPAFSARVPESASLDVMTLEISSFQLETVVEFHAPVVVWLNFAPDHLDRYSSLEEYRSAKLRIFERQTAEDFAIVNSRDQLPSLLAQRITFSAFVSGGDFELREGVVHFHGTPVLAMRDTHLRGAHNAENVMAALGVGFARGLTFEQMREPLCAYQPLPHRCETIRTLDGVEWVNDSKGTNLDSVEKALLSESRPVVLIAGGKDKGFEYESLTELVVEKCRSAVLLGEMADRIEAIWGKRLPCRNVGLSLEKAVAAAYARARPGDVVLFSPGTSSFDMFRNYADRGNQFRSLVQSLPQI